MRIGDFGMIQAAVADMKVELIRHRLSTELKQMSQQDVRESFGIRIE